MAGRGRRGRSWASPTGNLYTSLLLIDPAPLEHLAELPLVAAVGIRDGLASLPGLPDGCLALKWPNDILARGAKCVGILIESERLSSGRLAVVIGCGVNVDWVPDDAPYKVTSLRREGLDADLQSVFHHLAGGLERALFRWGRGTGFAAIREEWLSASTGRGAPCVINLPDRSEEGRFVDLDAKGRLILERIDGSRVVHSAGDLFFRGLPGAPVVNA